MDYTVTALVIYSAVISQLCLRRCGHQSLEQSEILAAREATNYSVSNSTIYSPITAKSFKFIAHYRGVPSTYWAWLLMFQGLFVLFMFHLGWTVVGSGSLLVWAFYAYAFEQCDKQGRLRGVKIESMFGPVDTFAGLDKFHWYAVVNTGNALDLLPESSDEDEDDSGEDEDQEVQWEYFEHDGAFESEFPSRGDLYDFHNVLDDGEEVIFDNDLEPTDDDDDDEGNEEDEEDEEDGNDGDMAEIKSEEFSPILSPHEPSDSAEETRMLDEWDRESFAPARSWNNGKIGSISDEEEEDDDGDFMDPDTPGSIQLVLKQANLTLPPVQHFQGYIGVYRHTKQKRTTVVHTCLHPLTYESTETFIF